MATTQTQMIGVIAKEVGIPALKVQDVVHLIRQTLVNDLKETGEARLPGVCSFTVRTRQARRSVNPRTLQAIHTKEKKYIRAKALCELNNVVVP